MIKLAAISRSLWVAMVVWAGLISAQTVPSVNPQQVSTEAKALAELFGNGKITGSDTLRVTSDLADAYRRATGYLVSDEQFIINRVSDGKNDLGYSVVTNELGKFYPMTFMVAVTLDLKVKGVRMLIYRETHGSDVKRTRFLYQYRGKTVDDPIRINRDIISISGATMSVNAMNRGVKKVLFILNYVLVKDVTR